MRQVTLLAAGADVATAADIQELLTAGGIRAAVVSLPCRALFDAQDEAYRDQVLGACTRVVLAITAAGVFDGLAGPADLIVTVLPAGGIQAVAALIQRRIAEIAPPGQVKLEAS